ncbi:hypothetical protein [Aeromonas salmonicida]|uniref:hypothetical protein n=1 Tax=Aeromonas salmonicida TaxID=645 RepID=UPI00259EF575|nr:hypothetical protein [Aeromonas salmonicida]MDM5112785.1 hypothetical protein [Aeromonas salmonicida]
MSNQTPAAHWREKGEPDPHGSYYDHERAALALGDLTDDELANAVFMHGDGKPSIAEIIAGTAKMPIVYLTAAKERIRWLSRKVEESKRIEQSMADVLRDARKYITALGKPECEISKVQMVIAQIEAIIAGQVQAQHPDDVAVDNFAKAMKEKLAKARAKGRSGWDDPAACSVEHLAELLLDHIGKGNQGTFEDIANFAMMLHQRGADPVVLVEKLPLPASNRRLLNWAVTCWHEQVAHRPMENVYRRTLDNVWRQVIRFAGEDPQSIIGPSHDDLLHNEPKHEGGVA